MFRKGKGRKTKRERCASYNDEDILGRGTGTEVEVMMEADAVGNEHVEAGECEFRKGRVVLVDMERGSEREKEEAATKTDESLYKFMVGGMSVRKENRD